MLSYCLGSVNGFHWGFKQVGSYSKHHTFSIFIGDEKENNVHLLYPGHLEYEQDDITLKRSIFKKREGERIQSAYENQHRSIAVLKQEGPLGRSPEEKVKGHSGTVYRAPLMLSIKYW